MPLHAMAVSAALRRPMMALLALLLVLQGASLAQAAISMPDRDAVPGSILALCQDLNDVLIANPVDCSK